MPWIAIATFALACVSALIARRHRPYIPDDALDRATLDRIVERHEKDSI